MAFRCFTTAEYRYRIDESGIALAMATVLVELTLPGDVDPARSEDVPAEVLALVQAAPGVKSHGYSKRGSDPWRARFLVRGPDCVETARSLERDLRDRGYDADASFWA